jgi:hypothetical protein
MLLRTAPGDLSACGNRRHPSWIVQETEAAMAGDQSQQRAPYPAEKARGGEIILRKPWQRAVFILGPAVPLLLLLLLLPLLR